MLITSSKSIHELTAAIGTVQQLSVRTGYIQNILATMNKPNTEVWLRTFSPKGFWVESTILKLQFLSSAGREEDALFSFRLQDQEILYLSMQLLISLVVIYHHSMLSMYLHASISTSKTGYCYDNKSRTSELTLVCIPKVRKNRIRCVMKRRRCPGSTLLSLESHLLTSSIKPITTKEMSALAIAWRKKNHLRNISKLCIYSTNVI